MACLQMLVGGGRQNDLVSRDINYSRSLMEEEGGDHSQELCENF